MNIIKLQRDIIFGSNDLSFINYYESRVAFQSPDPDFPQGGWDQGDKEPWWCGLIVFYVYRSTKSRDNVSQCQSQ